MLHLHHLPETQDGPVSVALEHQMVHLARISQLQGGRDVCCIKDKERAAALHHPPNTKHCFIDPVVYCHSVSVRNYRTILIIPFYKVLISSIVDDRQKERKCNCVDAVVCCNRIQLQTSKVLIIPFHKAWLDVHAAL